MALSLLPENFQVERLRLTIKLKANIQTKPSHPALKGFIVARTDQLRQMLATAEASGEDVVFFDVALWERKDDDYLYTGNVNESVKRVQYDTAEKPKATEAPRSEWY